MTVLGFSPLWIGVSIHQTNGVVVYSIQKDMHRGTISFQFPLESQWELVGSIHLLLQPRESPASCLSSMAHSLWSIL